MFTIHRKCLHFGIQIRPTKDGYRFTYIRPTLSQCAALIADPIKKLKVMQMRKIRFINQSRGETQILELASLLGNFKTESIACRLMDSGVNKLFDCRLCGAGVVER